MIKQTIDKYVAGYVEQVMETGMSRDDATAIVTTARGICEQIVNTVLQRVPPGHDDENHMLAALAFRMSMDAAEAFLAALAAHEEKTILTRILTGGERSEFQSHSPLDPMRILYRLRTGEDEAFRHYVGVVQFRKDGSDCDCEVCSLGRAVVMDPRVKEFRLAANEFLLAMPPEVFDQYQAGRIGIAI